MIDVKKLHKPTGTPPGFVTYTGQKLFVLRLMRPSSKMQK